LRDREAGGRDAVSRSRLLFVEVDAEASARLLERAPQPPSMSVLSGSRGHLHAYWLLDRAVSGAEVKSANRKLAHRVGGDLASVDESRILRPPETKSFKHDPPRPVLLESLHPERVYELRELIRGLDAPPAIRPERQRSPAARRLGQAPPDAAVSEQLRAIPTAVYVQRLTGLEPNREGKVSCPWHQDATPSLHCYPDGTFCCFGCQRGGSIFDFAGALWGMDTKGRAFLELRNRLAREFGITAPAQQPQRAMRRPLPLAGPSLRDLQRITAVTAAINEKGGR
jgi:hypothetical protein